MKEINWHAVATIASVALMCGTITFLALTMLCVGAL